MARKAPLTKKRAPKKAGAKKQSAEPQSAPIMLPNAKVFPIVAMGASAGGLEAFEAFFKASEPDAGLAYILVVHLDPTHISLLPELLQKHTTMPVSKIVDGTKVRPDNVYVIPPNHDLEIINGVLQLMPQARSHGVNLPIDSFFRSLATDQGTNAICIILSGTGSDGTHGLTTIKDKIGMIMVQDEDSAKYDGMPRNAIATGLVDFVQPPEKMPAQLVRYTKHASQSKALLASKTISESPNELQKIYLILRKYTGHDFSLYKINTIYRRIERRMYVHQIETISDYVSYLKDSKREAEILFKELLIGVTSFFRDPAIFETLRDVYLTELLNNKPNNYTIRVWVAGCSNGQEPYSLAIILQECMSKMQRHFGVQIFATDIDADAIAVARAGIYPEAIHLDVSPERLQAYFIKGEDGTYRVKKSIREMVVFAPQNIIKDPPFTKLDLLSCRNLLIYFSPELQRVLLPTFHYSLKADGILFLGSSETIGQATPNLFNTLDRKAKIFQRDHTIESTTTPMRLPAISRNLEQEKSVPATIRAIEEHSAVKLVEAILKQSNAPPCAIIDDASNIIYIHGHTGDFLEPPEGRISINILEMARPGLKKVLAECIRKVAIHSQEVVRRDLTIELIGSQINLDLLVRPIFEFNNVHGLMMVTFEQSRSSPQAKEQASSANPIKTSTKEDVERELLHTRENLLTAVEELEISNEELKSSNEELQSTNEELQSTNEEMETSKEELQSLNEESSTVNAELQSRIDELSITNDDIKNLLDSTEVATLFLDISMKIRRFTPKVTDIIPLTSADLGRPIQHFTSTLIDTNLNDLCLKVLDDLITREVEVDSTDGENYSIKALPYRTINNLIDGVVIAFFNITERKQAQLLRDVGLTRYRRLFNLSRDSVMLIEATTGKIEEFNREAHESLGYTRKEFEQLAMQDIESIAYPGEILTRINAIIATGGDSFETEHRGKKGVMKRVKVNAKAITSGAEKFLLCTWYDLPRAKAK